MQKPQIENQQKMEKSVIILFHELKINIGCLRLLVAI